ncbi:MAG: tetratricopeptide repeat protein [Phycisphaerales bacterium JB037]
MSTVGFLSEVSPNAVLGVISAVLGVIAAWLKTRRVIVVVKQSDPETPRDQQLASKVRESRSRVLGVVTLIVVFPVLYFASFLLDSNTKYLGILGQQWRAVALVPIFALLPFAAVSVFFESLFLIWLQFRSERRFRVPLIGLASAVLAAILVVIYGPAGLERTIFPSLRALGIPTSRVERLAFSAWQTVRKPGLEPAEYASAFAKLQEALELDPGDEGLIMMRGAAQYRLGQYQAALSSLQEALRIPDGVNRLETFAFLAMTSQAIFRDIDAAYYAQQARKLHEESGRWFTPGIMDEMNNRVR